MLGDALAGLVKEKLGNIRVRADTFGFLQRGDYSAFAVIPSLDPLSLGHFSPIFSPFPFFRHFLRLDPKIPETGTKTPKNGPKRPRNGR